MSGPNQKKTPIEVLIQLWKSTPIHQHRQNNQEIIAPSLRNETKTGKAVGPKPPRQRDAVFQEGSEQEFDQNSFPSF